MVVEEVEDFKEVVVVLEQPSEEKDVAVVDNRCQDPVLHKKSWISPSERLLMVRKAWMV